MAAEDFDIYFARAAALYRQSNHKPETCLTPRPSPSYVAPSRFTFDQAITTSIQSGIEQQPLPPCNSSIAADCPATANNHPPRRSVSCKYPSGSRHGLSPKSCLRGDTGDQPMTTFTAASGDPSSTHALPSSPSIVALSNADESASGVTGPRSSGLFAGLRGAFGAAAVGNSTSSAAAANVVSASGEHRAFNSAPHSRSSSWRKARRPRESIISQYHNGIKSGGVSLESEVIEKLQQLKLMQVDINILE